MDCGERGSDSSAGVTGVRIVVMLLHRPSRDDTVGEVIGLPMVVPPTKLLLRVLLPPEDSEELTVSMVVKVLVLIFRSREKALILLTGGELDFKVMGVCEMCDSGAA